MQCSLNSRLIVINYKRPAEQWPMASLIEIKEIIFAPAQHLLIQLCMLGRHRLVTAANTTSASVYLSMTTVRVSVTTTLSFERTTRRRKVDNVNTT